MSATAKKKRIRRLFRREDGRWKPRSHPLRTLKNARIFVRNSFKPFDSGSDFDGVAGALQELDFARSLVLNPDLEGRLERARASAALREREPALNAEAATAE